MFTMDETARIDSWNRGARRILGYDEEEILGQPGAVIFTPEDRQSGAVERELRVARETGHAIDERWHIRKDGSRFWGSGVVTSLWDGGVLRGYAKVMRDNTARKEAEETLRESEARLRGIFEIVTVGIIFIDESGTIVEANDTFLRDVGYSRSELEAGELSWQEPTPPEWKEVSREQMRQVHETGRIGPYEKEYYRKDGSRSWFLFAGVQLAGGSAVEFVIDISEQKAAEQALRESRQELQELADKLEDLVEERTEQVRLLASELVASEQKVRHRVARTLHDDLQQMLYAAEMQLQFLREDLGDEAQDDLEEMVKLVADSLRVTRRLTVDLSPPVLKGEGLPEALEWLANHMREVHSLQVRVEVGVHPRLRLEEQRILLFQIVRELLFNVVKHAGVREAQVTVRKAEGGIVVTVSDGGRGFDVESVTLEENGGFGLHNVRERLDLFGGRMEIDSQPGQGTRVTLFLPNAGPDVQTNEKCSNQG